MKKIISIFLLIIFMVQGLPVRQLLSNGMFEKAKTEMAGDIDTEDSKDESTEKGIKEKILLNKQHEQVLICKISSLLNSLGAENAIILHHADISTPPPDITG